MMMMMMLCISTAYAVMWCSSVRVSADHNILLYKLYNCGVRGIAHKWFVNYLYNRKQFTSVNNAVSMLNKRSK